MTRRVPSPPAPGPLEGYAARFDDLFGSLAQRRGFREYLTGLLAPRGRNKTLTALAGAEPSAGAQRPAVQRLQFFLSESRWDPDEVNARRLELLPAAGPRDGGVLVIDDAGHRKDGDKTAHVGRQRLGRHGTGNGLVTVTTAWAGERACYPAHAVPCTPARHFGKGERDPGFRARSQIAADLAARAREAGLGFRAAAADCGHGEQDELCPALAGAGLPFVTALVPGSGARAGEPGAGIPAGAARELAWRSPGDPGRWFRLTRAFRDGRAETWWAADEIPGWQGPAAAPRLVVATADPGTLPEGSTWYLATNLPPPGGPRQGESPHPPAGPEEIVRINGIREWAAQGCRQARVELGWADFQVRSDIAIRRHQALVNCALSFCWDTWLSSLPGPAGPGSGKATPPAGPAASAAALAGRMAGRAPARVEMHAPPGTAGGDRR